MRFSAGRLYQKWSIFGQGREVPAEMAEKRNSKIAVSVRGARFRRNLRSVQETVVLSGKCEIRCLSLQRSPVIARPEGPKQSV